MISEYSDKLAETEARLQTMTSEAASHKVRWLQLRADFSTMQENYDAQIAHLSTRLVESMNASAGRR